jgi:hypothetical protein
MRLEWLTKLQKSQSVSSVSLMTLETGTNLKKKKKPGRFLVDVRTEKSTTWRSVRLTWSDGDVIGDFEERNEENRYTPYRMQTET